MSRHRSAAALSAMNYLCADGLSRMHPQDILGDLEDEAGMNPLDGRLDLGPGLAVLRAIGQEDLVLAVSGCGGPKNYGRPVVGALPRRCGCHWRQTGEELNRASAGRWRYSDGGGGGSLQRPPSPAAFGMLSPKEAPALATSR